MAADAVAAGVSVPAGAAGAVVAGEPVPAGAAGSVGAAGAVAAGTAGSAGEAELAEDAPEGAGSLADGGTPDMLVTGFVVSGAAGEATSSRSVCDAGTFLKCTGSLSALSAAKA